MVERVIPLSGNFFLFIHNYFSNHFFIQEKIILLRYIQIELKNIKLLLIYILIALFLIGIKNTLYLVFQVSVSNIDLLFEKRSWKNVSNFHRTCIWNYLKTYMQNIGLLGDTCSNLVWKLWVNIFYSRRRLTEHGVSWLLVL